MSANNAIYVVDESDGRFTVWLDECVDEIFPLAAQLIGESPDEAEAMRLALVAADESYVEYGVSLRQGPTPCSERDERGSGGYCTLLYGHEGDEHLFAVIEDSLEALFAGALSAGACARCSSPGMATYHGIGVACDKDPEYVVNVIAEHFKEQGKYVGIVWEAVANETLRALGWRAGMSITIDSRGHVYVGAEVAV